MKLLVCALEASANLHLKEVLKYLDDIELVGIFDSALGYKPLYDSSEFGVMGIVDALKIYKKAKKALHETAKLALKCDAVLLIDSPAFNLPMAKELKRIGYTTVAEPPKADCEVKFVKYGQGFDEKALRQFGKALNFFIKSICTNNKVFGSFRIFTVKRIVKSH